MADLISLDYFCTLLSEILDRDPAKQLNAGARLVADLDCDSIELVEILVLMGELGVDLPEETDWSQMTIADLHRLSCLAAAR